MISPQKIEEWIREVEERPSSAVPIVQFVGNRLGDLARRNEELLAENILLRTDKKVEEYETRIANLEYQLELLKRQLGRQASGQGAFAPGSEVETLSLFVYTARGEVLRLEISPAELTSRQVAARFAAAGAPPAQSPADAAAARARATPRLLAARSNEELLFVFNSGRTVALPAAAIPASQNGLDWGQATLEEPRGGEELAVIVAVGRMSMADCIIQVSRRAYMKRMMRPAFESYVAKNFVGTGVKANTDSTCELCLCAKEDRLVIASQEGYLLSATTPQISYAIDDTLKLSPRDHIVSSFSLGQKKIIVFLTNNGKVVQRDTAWLEPAPSGSLKIRGQALFSEERRKSGVRLTAAAAVDETDWGAALDSSGCLTLYQMGDLLGAGSVFPTSLEKTRGTTPPALELVSFAAFTI